MSEDRESRFEDRPALDRAIDGAVREMLDVEQPAGFRGRVVTRLNASGSPRTSRFRLPVSGFGIAGAAAAALIIAVLLPSRTTEQPPASPIVAIVEPPRIPLPAPAPSVSAPRPQPPASAAPRVAAAPRPSAAAAPDRIVAATSFAPSGMTTEIEPLQSIAPIEMAPIADHRVAPPDISIRPLNPIVEVQIAPLSPPDGRN